MGPTKDQPPTVHFTQSPPWWIKTPPPSPSLPFNSLSAIPSPAATSLATPSKCERNINPGHGLEFLSSYLWTDDTKGLEETLRKGASPEVSNENGETLLHLAAAFGKPKIVNVLLKYRAKTEARERKLGRTPLHLAVDYKHLSVIKALLKGGAYLEAQGWRNETPLHLAAGNTCVDVVNVLLDAGASKRAIDQSGRTPLQVAQEKKRDRIIHSIQNRSAKEEGTTCGRSIRPNNLGPPLPSYNLNRDHQSRAPASTFLYNFQEETARKIISHVTDSSPPTMDVSQQPQAYPSRSLIDEKYFFPNRRLPEVIPVSENPSSNRDRWTPSFSLKTLNQSFEELSQIRTPTIYTEGLDLPSTKVEFRSLQSLEDLSNCKQWTFVLAGRKSDALIPEPAEEGRVVLVIPFSQQESAAQYVARGCDVLLIKTVDDEECTGLPTDRRIAISEFAEAINLKLFAMIDDNVEGVAFAKQLDTWPKIFDHLKNIATNNDLAILSLQTYSGHFNAEMPQCETEQIRLSKQGAKVFLVSLEKISEKGIPKRQLWPKDRKKWGEDVYVQYLIPNVGLKAASIDRKHGVIKRADSLKNTCVGRVSNPSDWMQECATDDDPDLVKKTIQDMQDHYQHSKKHYQEELIRLENLDLHALHTGKPGAYPSSSIQYTPHNMSALEMAEQAVSDILGQPPVTWRNCQVKALRALKTHLEENKVGQFDMATGSGKTKIFANLALQMAHLANQGQNTLIITPRTVIDGQVFQELKRSIPKGSRARITVVDSSKGHIPLGGFEINKRIKKDGNYVVVMCMASAKAFLEGNISNSSIFDTIIVDESHSTSKSLAKLLRESTDKHDQVLLGFSATPNKCLQEIRDTFGSTIYEYSLGDALQEGVCTPWEVQLTNEYQTSEKVETLVPQLSNYLRHQETNNGQRLRELPGIIYTGRVELANQLSMHLNQPDEITAAPYHSKLSETERSTHLANFESTKTKILVTAQMLQEGYDGRPYWALFLDHEGNRLTRELGTQILGRVVRTVPSDPEKLAWFGVVSTNLERSSELKSITKSLNQRTTNLHKAILDEEFEEASDIIDTTGCGVWDFEDENQHTPLYLASRAGNGRLVGEMLRAGANLNAQDRDGNTPFHIAVKNRKLGVVKVMTPFMGCYLTTPDDEGNTPLHSAIAFNCPQTTAILCALEKRPGANTKGQTPLHLAALKNNYKAVKKLMSGSRCDEILDAQDQDGNTALHIAALNKSMDVMDLIHEHGPTILENKGGKTPYDIYPKYRRR